MLLLFCMHFDCKMQEFILKFDMSGGANLGAKFITKGYLDYLGEHGESEKLCDVWRWDKQALSDPSYIRP